MAGKLLVENLLKEDATSLVSHLAREGRVRICLVESAT